MNKRGFLENLVINGGSKILSLSLVLDLIVVILLVVGGFISGDFLRGVYFILGAIVYLMIAILSKYVLFAIRNIQENIEKIAEK